MIARGTKLKPGCFYRIVEISPADPDPTLRVGDVVHCEAGKRRALRQASWWRKRAWTAISCSRPRTLVTGLEELPTLGGVA